MKANNEVVNKFYETRTMTSENQQSLILSVILTISYTSMYFVLIFI